MTAVTPKKIFLLGMMGTGKSTIGRSLANKLGFDFIDSDNWIEESLKMKIPQIFEKKGEDYFRSLEKNFILKELPSGNYIIACGGGLCIPPGMMDLLKKEGITICLTASADQIFQRIGSDPNRPLLEGSKTTKQIEDILAKRKETYDSADLVIKTDHLSPERIIDSIITSLDKFWG